MGSYQPEPPVKGIKIAIDRGGTFTDIWATAFNSEEIVLKLLSVDPENYADAPTEGIRRVLSIYYGYELPRHQPLPKTGIECIRMGTTVATNALLERKGSKHAFLVTKGFADLLEIGDQTRPKLFELNIRKPETLYDFVAEVEERVTIEGFDEDIDGLFANAEPVAGELEMGTNGQLVRVLQPLDEAHLKDKLVSIRAKGIDNVAICFAHSYAYPNHEARAGQLAIEAGFANVSLSSQVAANMIRMVPRGSSATADAYLTPEIRKYLAGFISGFEGGHLDGVRCEFMQSDGGLVRHDRFSGLKGILSGPAGGVVGYAKTSYDASKDTPVIGFDMGGTSTDVSRFGGRFEHVFETTTAGVVIQSPQLDINTVAAGGGSILQWRNGLFCVGPESAGSHPGPACYRKGGPLTVTDANLFLGRLVASAFPQIFGSKECEPLDEEVVKDKFLALTAVINIETGRNITPEEVASGFLDVANESMCRPIRALTEAKGYMLNNHWLNCFGGAGGQHACHIAAKLGIKTTVIHKYSSILSAYGMALADVVEDAQKAYSAVYSPELRGALEPTFEDLRRQVTDAILDQGIPKDKIMYEYYLNMKYAATETAIMTMEGQGFKEEFLKQHMQEFSFVFPDDRQILIEDIRVRGIGNFDDASSEGGSQLVKELGNLSFEQTSNVPASTKSVFFQPQGIMQTPIYRLGDLPKSSLINGPAIILDNTQTIVVVPDAAAKILSSHVVIEIASGTKQDISESVADPAVLSVFSHRFMSIAEQMGRALQSTSVSLNIKERLDFSCAVFGPDGGLVANAPHVPVHLGSMGHAIRHQHRTLALEGKLRPGDVILTNHPELGNIHLPDLTVITPIFEPDGTKIAFYVGSRGHHTDIGGLGGTSMPPTSTELWQEGAIFKSHILIQDGVFDEEGVCKVLLSPGEHPGCVGSRRLSDNISDLKAQVAANQKGVALIQSLIDEFSLPVVQLYMQAIQDTAESTVRSMLRGFHESLGPILHAEDSMDNGSFIKLKITLQEDGDAMFDFEGTSPQLWGNMNCSPSMTHAALLYSLRCMVDADIPLNQGCLNPCKINLPKGSLLNPHDGAAVCAGNTQTSQRLADTILKAFQVAGASQGCMNCLGFFGKGGKDKDGKPLEGYAYAFGETIGGGVGATATSHGASGVHSHMTNTKITDAESLEKRYPVILREFSIRKGTGGRGLFNGGNGIVRDIECRSPLTFSVITDRRVTAPYGMLGGENGARGENRWVKKNEDGSEAMINVGIKGMFDMKTGDRLVMRTPGGGGFGTPGSSQAKALVNGIGSEHQARASGSLVTFAATQASAN